MFDVDIPKLGIIGLVALLVLGPERLPKVARAAGRWVGKLQRYVSDVKADINRETELAELRALRQDVESTGQEIEQEVHSIQPPDDYSMPLYRPIKKKFRTRRAAVPLWYKRQQGLRAYVQSGAARVKRHRKQ